MMIAMALAPAAAAAQAQPITARAIRIEVNGSDLTVTLGVGRDQGVVAGARAHCRVGKLTVDGAIVKVTRTTSVTRLSNVTFDGIPSKITCELSPP